MEGLNTIKGLANQKGYSQDVVTAILKKKQERQIINELFLITERVDDNLL